MATRDALCYTEYENRNRQRQGMVLLPLLVVGDPLRPAFDSKNEGMSTMIALACDHTALAMKQEIMGLLDEMGLAYQDFGTYDTERCHYPIYGARAAKAVASGVCDRGILICGTGVGISLSANKVKGIRCVVCSEPYSAQLSRQHNDTNMLAFGARVIGPELAKMIVRIWLETPFEGGRHQTRIDMITALENGEEIE